MLKKLCALVLTNFLLICALPTNVLAEENNEQFNDKFEISTLKLGEKQIHKLNLKNGEIGYISVQKIKENKNSNIILPNWIKWHTRDNVTDGTYEINVVLGAANAGFTIEVKNYKITSAYDPWHFMVISSASGNLTLDSSTKATYLLNFNMSIPWVNGPSWTGGVQARIENKKLVTYYR